MKTTVIHVRSTDAEKTAWEKAAGQAGQSLAHWLRSVANEKLTPAIEKPKPVKRPEHYPSPPRPPVPAPARSERASFVASLLKPRKPALVPRCESCERKNVLDNAECPACQELNP